MKRLFFLIKMRIKRFKVIISKIKKGHDVFPSNREITGYEGITCSIVRKMINHKDSSFTIAPLSGKRYIVNKTLDIFVIMEDSRIEITNHVYHYVVTLDRRQVEKLTLQYDKKVDSYRLEYERQIISQINSSLHHIFDKVNQA